MEKHKSEPTSIGIINAGTVIHSSNVKYCLSCIGREDSPEMEQ